MTDHDPIEYIWGVIDTVPETNFPDIRNRCVIHSKCGSCMVIPREGDKVRLYIQLSDKQVVDQATGRVDKNKISPDHLLQVELSHLYASSCGSLNFYSQAVKDILAPYTIDARSIEWWTIYISTPPFATFRNLLIIEYSRPTSRIQVFRTRTCFYRWRRLSHPLSQGWTGHERQHERYPQSQ